MPFYESWAKTSDTQFTNLNYSICGGEVVENDHGKIEARNGQIVYGDSHKLTSVSGTEVILKIKGAANASLFSTRLTENGWPNCNIRERLSNMF